MLIPWSATDNQYYIELTESFLPYGKTRDDIFMISGNFVFSSNAGDELANRVVSFTHIINPMDFSYGAKYWVLPFALNATGYYLGVSHLMMSVGVSSTKIYFKSPCYCLTDSVRVADDGTKLSHISDLTIVYV